MNGVRGKLASMSGHAYLHSFWDADREDASVPVNMKRMQAIAYMNSERAYKITLVVDTVEELRALQDKYRDICGTSLVTDAGFTVFNEPTTTCLGLGPIAEENIGDDIKSLKTFT